MCFEIAFENPDESAGRNPGESAASYPNDLLLLSHVPENFFWKRSGSHNFLEKGKINGDDISEKKEETK